MKILHTEASEGWGGQDMRVLREAVLMRERGHEVVLACAPGCPLFNAAQSEGLPVEPVRFGRKLNISVVRATVAIIKRHKIEIVNTHSSADGWSGAVAARLTGCLSVRTRHLANRVRPRPANRLLYHRLTDFVITTGEAVRRQLLEDLHLPPGRVASIPTGVDTELFNPALHERLPFRREVGADEDEFLWVMVAMLRRIKGHPILAEAAVKLLQSWPRVRFVLVGDVPGDSPVRAELEQLLEKLGVRQRVTLTGFRDDIPAILAGCDAVVLPSLSEGLPQALTQALAMAKPVVATAVGGVPELVRAGETGLLVPAGDAVALAEAMGQVMADPTAAAQRAAAGRRLVEQEYSLQAMVERVERVYQSLQ